MLDRVGAAASSSFRLRRDRGSVGCEVLSQRRIPFCQAADQPAPGVEAAPGLEGSGTSGLCEISKTTLAEDAPPPLQPLTTGAVHGFVSFASATR
jgi:hypothetical protein